MQVEIGTLNAETVVIVRAEPRDQSPRPADRGGK
jgi:hypothetical protein